TRQAVGNSNEAVGVDHGDVTSDIPAVPQYFCRLLGLAEIPEHTVWSLHQQETCVPIRQGRSSLAINDLCPHTCQWMAYRSRLIASLAIRTVFDIRHIDRDYRGHFCTAIAFQEIETILVLKGLRQGGSQLLGAGDGIAQ